MFVQMQSIPLPANESFHRSAHSVQLLLYIVQGEKVNQAELSNFAARGGITYSPDQIKIYKSIGGTPFLDQQYTVFGEVIDGFEVIDKIANVQTGANNRPVKDLKMTVKLIDE
jgi:cyclophilin family peptidyl-prolyl cis-trans isomerase